MSKLAKLALGLAGAMALSGCFIQAARTQPEEIVIVEPAPVIVEPIQTKY